MNSNVQRGAIRACVVAAALWIAGMGWYQYNEAEQAKDSSITINLSKDTQLHIDANGIKKDDAATQHKRLAWIFLPPLALLLIVSGAGWVTRGFKQT